MKPTMELIFDADITMSEYQYLTASSITLAPLCNNEFPINK